MKSTKYKNIVDKIVRNDTVNPYSYGYVAIRMNWIEENKYPYKVHYCASISKQASSIQAARNSTHDAVMTCKEFHKIPYKNI